MILYMSVGQSRQKTTTAEHGMLIAGSISVSVTNGERPATILLLAPYL